MVEVSKGVKSSGASTPINTTENSDRYLWSDLVAVPTAVFERAFLSTYVDFETVLKQTTLYNSTETNVTNNDQTTEKYSKSEIFAISPDCQRSLRFTLTAFKARQTWAVKMFSSWGRLPPAGMASGTLTNLGDGFLTAIVTLKYTAGQYRRFRYLEFLTLRWARLTPQLALFLLLSVGLVAGPSSSSSTTFNGPLWSAYVRPLVNACEANCDFLTEDGMPSPFVAFLYQPWNHDSVFFIGLLFGVTFSRNFLAKVHQTPALDGRHRLLPLLPYSTYPYVQGRPYYKNNNDENSAPNWYNLLPAMLFPLNRILWAVALTCAIWLCATGNGGHLGSLLSWSAFRPISRASYALYLMHAWAVWVALGTRRTLIPLADGWSLALHLLAVVFGSLFVGITFNVLVETPFINALEHTWMIKREQLNVDVLCCVFQFISFKEKLQTLRLVSRKWKKAVEEGGQLERSLTLKLGGGDELGKLPPATAVAAGKLTTEAVTLITTPFSGLQQLAVVTLLSTYAHSLNTLQVAVNVPSHLFLQAFPLLISGSTLMSKFSGLSFFDHSNQLRLPSSACRTTCTFFISANLVACVALVVVSILPKVQESQSGLLQASVVSLNSSPDTDCKPCFLVHPST
ncbi:hypothetical protein TYRP_023498 [Tyrophagus putrescentiae]|nr:hypothetical protein TYRP_023498 [Tyrophagus putrescentiae]